MKQHVIKYKVVLSNYIHHHCQKKSLDKSDFVQLE